MRTAVCVTIRIVLHVDMRVTMRVTMRVRPWVWLLHIAQRAGLYGVLCVPTNTTTNTAASITAHTILYVATHAVGA